MKVRLAVDEDLKELARMGLALKWHEEECGFNGYADDQTYIEQWAKFLVLSFEDGRHSMFVAEDDEGNVVGGLIGCVVPMELMYKHPLAGQIVFIWVDPYSRTHILAEGLVEAFENDMKVKNISTVFGVIYSANIRPQKALKNRGYSLEFVQMFKEV